MDNYSVELRSKLIEDAAEVERGMSDQIPMPSAEKNGIAIRIHISDKMAFIDIKEYGIVRALKSFRGKDRREELVAYMRWFANR